MRIGSFPVSLDERVRCTDGQLQSCVPAMSASNLNIKDLFADAIELPEAQRETFVRDTAAKHPEIAAAVLGLLRAAIVNADLLAEPRGTALGKLNASAALATGREPDQLDPRMEGADSLWSLEGPGTVFGKYTLLEVLGEGGFGVVYRAQQSEPVKRQVALKLLKPGMDTRSVVSRFRAEQEALALMDHPGIAKVLDAGSTPSGRPFVVMELVAQAAGKNDAASELADGASPAGTKAEVITSYCNRKQLPVRQRIELAIEVCRALQHAHGKGVIHRDIKPSNVLVTEVDGVARAKMIDFGIAKAVRPGTLSRVHTEQWQLIGTPEYMAPEQLDNAATADVRTDVYGLGTLLYEMLCGTTPFDPVMLRSLSLERLHEVVRTNDPPRPSARLSGLLDADSIAIQRRVTLGTLKSQLRGELDWIVQRCLAKEPQRRYQTAAAVADDLQRWIDHRPVEAGPLTASYAASKWLRRHRGLAIAALAVLATLLAGLAGTGVALYHAGRERASAVASASEAKRQAGRAEKVTRFLVDDMFGSLRPEVTRSREITVREIAENATNRIPQQFGDDDQTRIIVQTTLADVWLKIGENQRSRDLYADTLALAEKLFGSDAPQLVEVLIGYAASLEFTGQHSTQQNLARRALRIAEANFAANSPVRIRALLALANAERYMTDLADARALLDRLSPLENDQSELAVSALILKSDLLRGSTDLSQRAPILEQALAKNVQLLGLDHPRNHEIRIKLAYAYLDQSRFQEAERLMLEHKALADRLFAPDSVQASEVQRLLAKSLAGQHRDAEAAAAYMRCLDIAIIALGETNIVARTTLGTTAEAFADAGMLTEAVALAERAQAIESSLGPTNLDNTLTASRRYGRVLLLAGQNAPALQVAQDGVALAEANNSAFRIGMRRLLGDALLANGRAAEGDLAFTQAVLAAVDYVGENSPRINEVLTNAFQSLSRAGYPDRAAKYATLASFRAATGPR